MPYVSPSRKPVKEIGPQNIKTKFRTLEDVLSNMKEQEEKEKEEKEEWLSWTKIGDQENRTINRYDEDLQDDKEATRFGPNRKLRVGQGTGASGSRSSKDNNNNNNLPDLSDPRNLYSPYRGTSSYKNTPNKEISRRKGFGRSSTMDGVGIIKTPTNANTNYRRKQNTKNQSKNDQKSNNILEKFKNQRIKEAETRKIEKQVEKIEAIKKEKVSKNNQKFEEKLTAKKEVSSKFDDFLNKELEAIRKSKMQSSQNAQYNNKTSQNKTTPMKISRSESLSKYSSFSRSSNGITSGLGDTRNPFSQMAGIAKERNSLKNSQQQQRKNSGQYHVYNHMN